MDNLFNNVNKLCKDIENISNISIIEQKGISINYEIPTLLKAINKLLSNDVVGINYYNNNIEYSKNNSICEVCKRKGCYMINNKKYCWFHSQII